MRFQIGILLSAFIGQSMLPAWASADEPSANPTTLTFAQGGTIRVTLKTGAVEIVGTSDDKIRVSWQSAPSEQGKRVRIDLQQASAKEAEVEVDGPGNHTQYRIEVPRRSNLVVSMQAGDLGVRGVLGNLSANLLAGNLDLRIAGPNDYRAVSGSVTTGGLTAKPWYVDKGGLFRSFETSGTGEFEIKAHVLAGQLTIREDRGEAR